MPEALMLLLLLLAIATVTAIMQEAVKRIQPFQRFVYRFIERCRFIKEKEEYVDEREILAVEEKTAN